MKFELTSSQSELINEISKQGYIWIVGGAVRDVLMGQVPKDIDFCTDLTPSTIKSIAVECGYIAIPDQKAEDHGIIRVVDKETGELIDIATLRKDVSCDGRHAQVEFTTDILTDLSRRDLTINSIAVEIDHLGGYVNLIDPSQGQEDIKSQVIKFIGNPLDRIQEDYVRMVRACRFTALGDHWVISKCDAYAIKECAHEIKNISKERIRDEIIKALGYPKPSNFFRSLYECGLLTFIMPDLAMGVGVEQNEHHAETIFEHLLRCLDSSVELTNNLMLRLAALTHDIAKPHTLTVAKDGRTHFYKHEITGASVIYKWMKEYKFSNEQCEYVSKLVRHHQWRFEKTSKDKTIRRWLQAVGQDWRDLITLRCADRRGNLKKIDKPMMTSQMRELVSRAEFIIDSHQALFKEDLAVNGKDIEALGIKPGKIYSEIFSNLLGIVINDPDKNTKDWLTDYVKRNYTKVSTV